MRHLSTKSLGLFAVTAMLFIGCQNATSPGTNTQSDGTMKANVNNTSWSSASVLGVNAGTLAVHNRTSNTLTITGTSIDLSGKTQTMTLTLYGPHVGLDSLGITNIGSWSVGTPGQDSYLTAGFGAGIVNVSKYDTTAKLVSGTFNFTAHQASNINNTVTVTNGSFVNIGYTEQ